MWTNLSKLFSGGSLLLGNHNAETADLTDCLVRTCCPIHQILNSGPRALHQCSSTQDPGKNGKKRNIRATKKNVLLSMKTWLLNDGILIYNGLMKQSPHNWVVESPIYPKHSNSPLELRQALLLASPIRAIPSERKTLRLH